MSTLIRVHPLDPSRAVVNNLLPHFGQEVTMVIDLRTVVSAPAAEVRSAGSRIASAAKFAMTAVFVFTIMFVALNWGAYRQRIAYWYQSINPSAEKTQEQKLLASLLDTDKGSTQRVYASDAVQNDVRLQEDGIDFRSLEIAPPRDYLIIPKLGLTVPIEYPSEELLQTENWDALEQQIQKNLERGVVHYPGTSEPGERGVTFITGHSSYYAWSPGNYKDVFALLPTLKVGDQVVIWHDGVRYVYEAFDIQTVKPTDTHVLTDLHGEYDSELRLMTCTPVGTAIDRFVISFRQIHPDPVLNGEHEGELLIGGSLNA